MTIILLFASHYHCCSVPDIYSFPRRLRPFISVKLLFFRMCRSTAMHTHCMHNEYSFCSMFIPIPCGLDFVSILLPFWSSFPFHRPPSTGFLIVHHSIACSFWSLPNRSPLNIMCMSIQSTKRSFKPVNGKSTDARNGKMLHTRIELTISIFDSRKENGNVDIDIVIIRQAYTISTHMLFLVFSSSGQSERHSDALICKMPFASESVYLDFRMFLSILIKIMYPFDWFHQYIKSANRRPFARQKCIVFVQHYTTYKLITAWVICSCCSFYISIKWFSVVVCHSSGPGLVGDHFSQYCMCVL